mmetsp:Transcript_6861/g.22656  ORF Transcript_6861/g.22656 Transcript_6861/m.22656 type:complete len:302 (+) Transcript_6861:257-1162(+)
MEVPLEHRNRHLPDGGHEGGVLLDALAKVGELRKVDRDRARLHLARLDLELWMRDPRDDDVGGRERLVLRHLGLLDLDRAVHAPLAVDEHVVDVHRVDQRAIVRQHRRQRPPHHLGAVVQHNCLAGELLANGQLLLVGAEVVEDLEDGEGCAGEDGLPVAQVGEHADVVVQRVAVPVVQALDVLLHRDDVAQVVINRAAKDGIVDNDAVDGRVLVGLDDGVLQIHPLHLTQLVLDAVASTRPLRPPSVHHRRLILVGDDANQLWPRAARLHADLDLLLDLVAERQGAGGDVDLGHRRTRGK